jgi:hypothetical protein
VTRHPTGDELILRSYGELSAVDAASVDRHLDTCPICHDAWTELRATMTMASRARSAEPPPDLEQIIWARVAPALPRRRQAWTRRQIVPIGTWAAAVLLVAGLQVRERPGEPPPAPSLVSADAVSPVETHRRVLFSALDEHLAQTEILLVELMNAPAESGLEFGFEQGAAADLLASGRLYRHTAWHTGDLHVVAMLDELEGVLVDVARGPAPGPEDVNLLRARIDAGDLLFMVRAVTTEIRDHQPRPGADGE